MNARLRDATLAKMHTLGEAIDAREFRGVFVPHLDAVPILTSDHIRESEETGGTSVYRVGLDLGVPPRTRLVKFYGGDKERPLLVEGGAGYRSRAEVAVGFAALDPAAVRRLQHIGP